MSPDEMLLDPLQKTMRQSDEPRPDKPRIAPVPAPSARTAAEPARAPSRRRGARPPPAVPPVRTIVVDRAPEPVLPPQQREALRAASSTGPERLRLEDVSIDYGAKKGRQVGVAVDPPGRGAGADRAVGLRQDDAAADAQPPHRADARAPRARAACCSTARTSTRWPTRRCARAWRWSSSSPTRFRCRSSTTSPSRCANSRASARAGASSNRW